MQIVLLENISLKGCVPTALQIVQLVRWPPLTAQVVLLDSNFLQTKIIAYLCVNDISYLEPENGSSSSVQICIKNPPMMVNVLKFNLKEEPLLYEILFDSTFDMISVQNYISLYRFYNSSSDNSAHQNMTVMSHTLNQISSTTYELTLVSYTESNQTYYLLLSFDQLNSKLSDTYIVTPQNMTADVYKDISTAQAADTVGSVSKPVFIATSSIALLSYLQSKGASSQLMRILHIMARVNFMKLINVNFLTPLGVFYEYTDLGQFGLPNIIGNILGKTNTSSQSSSYSSLFVVNSQRNVMYNSYFNYSFSQVFLDNYGGVIFGGFITFMLYLLAIIVAKCIKNRESTFKKKIVEISKSFKKSLLMTLLTSRYMYLCAGLILNYAFLSPTGVYEWISLIFAVIFTLVLFSVLLLALGVAFFHGSWKQKLKSFRSVLLLIVFLRQDYRIKSFVGRFFPFWTLLSNLKAVLILILLSNWPILQLSLLMSLDVITIVLSVRKNIFKQKANKIIILETEIGFLLISIIFLIMHSLEGHGSASSYNTRLALSWIGVGINIVIMLFPIVVDMIDWIRQWRKNRKAKLKEKKIRIFQGKESSKPKTTTITSDILRIAADSSNQSSSVEVAMG